MLLIAGGVGITPMRPLFETMDLRGGRLTLLYRVSSPADVVFGAELHGIARLRGAEIVWMVGRSSDPANQMTADNLRLLVPDVCDRDVYLCASPGLSASVREALRGTGLPPHRLHEEVFSFWPLAQGTTTTEAGSNCPLTYGCQPGWEPEKLRDANRERPPPAPQRSNF